MDISIKVLMFLPMFLVIGISTKHVQDQTKERDEQYLRVMIQTLMEQNRRLTLKNKQLHQVWKDVQDICMSVNTPACDCHGKQDIASDVAEPFAYSNLVRESRASQGSDVSLQIKTIKSSRRNTNVSRLSVTYMSTLPHTTEWVGLRENGGMWRAAGNRNTSDGKIFTSFVQIEEPDSIKDLILFLNNEEESVSVRFNNTGMATNQDQDIMKPNERFLSVDKRFEAMNDTDLNISIIVYETLPFLKDYVSFEIYFTGVNGTSSEIFEIFSFNSDLITIDMFYRTNTTANMVITVSQIIAKYGGILTVRFWFPMTGLLKDLYHGPIIKISAPESEDIVRNDTMGVFPLAGQTIVFQPSSTLMCAAMGNPRPNVTIIRVRDGLEGAELERKAEVIARDTNLMMKVLTLQWDQTEGIEGRYICRASNGNRTIESSTEVIAFDHIVFNDTYTGVVHNDSNIITMSCMATGKPRPELSLRLYSDYGPSLVNAGEYKVWKEDMFVSRVTLTIAAEDSLNYHTVFCIASQVSGHHEHAKIEIFPEVKQIFNWDLYEHIEKMNKFL